MTVTVDGYFSTVQTSSTTWNGVQADHVGQWLVVIHMAKADGFVDMGSGDPGQGLGWPPGAWHLLTQIDVGLGLPKARVWVTRFVDTVSRSLVLPASNGTNPNNHSYLYFLSGLRDSDNPEQVFSVGANSSDTPGTSQVGRLYAPDDSGLLIGAWISVGLVNYTSLGGMTARAELDSSRSTSRAGEQTITAHGPSTRTATASVAQPWASVSVVARDAGGSVTFPASPVKFRTELALGANPSSDPTRWASLWTDVTDDVDMRDAVTITRGRSDEASTSQPSTMALNIDNTAGKYVRLNPNSPFYGLLSKNTPIRLWVDAGSGWDVRYTGFVSEWPPRSQGGQVDEHMPIQAAGVTRRLAQGRVLRSPLYRSITSKAAFDAYWALEVDASSGIPGGQPMALSGPFRFGDGPAGSAGAISFDSGGTATAKVPGTVNPARGWHVAWFLEIPEDFDEVNDFSIMVNWLTPGAGGFNQWFAYVAPGFGGKLAMDGFDFGVNEFAMQGAVDLRGRGPVLVVATAFDFGGGTIEFQFDVYGTDFHEFQGTTPLTGTIASITSVGINGYQSANNNPDTKGTVSHLFVANQLSDVRGLADQLVAAGIGYTGERAAERIRRLSAETGIAAVVVGDDGTSAPMGPQPIGTALDLFRDAEAADGGVLYEQRDGRLAYQPRAARLNATPALTLDYASGHVAPPLEPTDDDQRSRNDWTITRQGGSSARVTDQDSIAEIGLYDDSATLNVESDDQLLDEAGWRVHLGTTDEVRYPAVTPNLLGTPELIPDWVSLDVGDAATITNPGRDLPPGDIALVVEGYTETIDVTEWRATANCSPGKPYKVGILDDDVLARLDTDGSTLAAGITSTGTTLSVATTSGPLWTTDETDMPVDVTVGGEAVTVTSVGQTLNANPYFDVNVSGWTGLNATVARSTAQVHPSGVASILVTPDGVSANGGVNSDLIPGIVPGKSYTALMWVFSPGGWPDLRVGFDWNDATGALIVSAFDGLTAAPAGMWTRLVTTLTAPAGAAQARVRGRHLGTPASTDIWYAWGIRLIPAGSPQQMTVIRSINGVVKSHGSGEDVRLTQPMILSL